MLKHCTFCKHYNIHAVYFPELYGLPLSTICVKLQWPRMYEEGELEDTHMSQVWFRDGNKIEADLHFGCQLVVFNDPGAADFSKIMEFFTQLSADKDD